MDVERRGNMKKFGLKFEHDRCKGCSLCVSVCPTKILELNKENINAKGYNTIKVIDESKCIGCTFCGLMCPDCVITITKESD